MTLGRLVIQEEARALGMLADTFPENFPQAIQHLRTLKGKIVCSGVGKSGHVARKVSATFSSTGAPSFFVHPTEALHGDLGGVSHEDGLLVFSNFGETPELLRFIRHSQSKVKIAITSRAKSSLSFCCDVVLLIPELKEACHLGLAPTTSAIMMMSLGDALALTLSSLKEFQKEDYQRLHPAGALGHRLLTVGQVMRSPAPLVHERSSCEDILSRMVEHRVGRVGLVDDQGKLVRVVTYDHIPELLKGRSLQEGRPPLMIPPQMRILEALSLLKTTQENFLFVAHALDTVLGVFCHADGVRVSHHYV